MSLIQTDDTSSVSCGCPCHLTQRWPAASTEEVSVMAEARNGGVKTLGIKVPDALHAQFALVAQLDGISLEMRPCGPSSCTSPPRRLSPTLLRELRPRSEPLSRRRRHGEG